MELDYAARIAVLNRALGIPANYATTRCLPLQAEAVENELVSVATPAGAREVRLLVSVAAQWSNLAAAAALDEIILVPLSGFRSVARQVDIFRRKLAAGQAIADILRVNAAPGYSEHHTGRAIDLGAPGEPPLEATFERTAAFRWLARRGEEFGFHLSYPRDNAQHLTFEPWHWCWRGHD